MQIVNISAYKFVTLEDIETLRLAMRERCDAAGLKGTILLSADSVESRMSSIAKNEIYFGSYTPLEETCRSIDAVRPEDLRRVARKLLVRDREAVLVLGPKPSPAVLVKLKALSGVSWKRLKR